MDKDPHHIHYIQAQSSRIATTQLIVHFMIYMPSEEKCERPRTVTKLLQNSKVQYRTHTRLSPLNLMLLYLNMNHVLSKA